MLRRKTSSLPHDNSETKEMEMCQWYLSRKTNSCCCWPQQNSWGEAENSRQLLDTAAFMLVLLGCRWISWFLIIWEIAFHSAGILRNCRDILTRNTILHLTRVSHKVNIPKPRKYNNKCQNINNNTPPINPHISPDAFWLCCTIWIKLPRRMQSKQ